MIYIISKEQKLFSNFTPLSVQESLEIIESWKYIQFDTETKGRDPHIGSLLSAQFGSPDKSTQIVVDCSTISITHYKKVLEEKLIVGQNLKFDLQWLYNYNIVPLKIYDTMIVEQVLHLGFPPVGKPGGISYALNEIAFRYLGVYIDKSIRGKINYLGLVDEVIEYAANDVVHLGDIASKQYEICKKTNQYKAAKLECDFVPVIAYLEWCGIKLDENKWKEKMKNDTANRYKALSKLQQFILDYYTEHKGKDNYILKPFCVDSTYDELWYKKIPSNLQPASAPYKRKKKFKDGREVEFLYQDYKVPFFIKNKSGRIVPFIQSNIQLDLFKEVATGPQCVINFDSSDQVVYLAKILGFDTTIEDKETGEEKDSALEKVLIKQKGICDEFLNLMFGVDIDEDTHIYGYKEASKVCNTYGQTYLNAINPNTGRIHTTFKQLGASSGRMACGSKQENTDLKELIKDKLKALPDPKLRKVGYPQIQNLPSDKTTRAAFVPNKGNLMTSCDYNALESRLGADIYQEQSMIDEYLHGSGDIHSLTAKHCFPEELKDIEVKDIQKTRPDLRSQAKPVEFSQQFGGSAKAIQNALGCSKELAVKIAKAYNEGFKGIAKFKKKGFAFAKEHGYVIICQKTGHRTYMEGWNEWKEFEDKEDWWEEYYEAKVSMLWEDFKETSYYKKASAHRFEASKWERLALNSPTQGSGIIILKRAMTLFFHWIVQEGLFGKVLICNLIHDEAVIEYPEALENTVVPKLKECMEAAANEFCKSLPIPAVPETGDHWIH